MTGRVGGKPVVVAHRVEDVVARTPEPLHEFRGIESGMARREAVDHPEVAVGAPAVEVRTEESIRIGAVAQVPPYEASELRLEQLAQAVGVIEAVDEARGLPALLPGVTVVFGDDQFDVRPRSAKVIRDVLPEIRRIGRPVSRGLKQ